jgi:hypothetical protein
MPAVLPGNQFQNREAGNRGDTDDQVLFNSEAKRGP